MREHRADPVLVTEGPGQVFGIFTGCDAVRRVLAESRNADRATLAEVMTRDPAILPFRSGLSGGGQP